MKSFLSRCNWIPRETLKPCQLSVTVSYCLNYFVLQTIALRPGRLELCVKVSSNSTKLILSDKVLVAYWATVDFIFLVF